MPHLNVKKALQIGTTGMLKTSGHWLAERSRHTTILSRQPGEFCNTLIKDGHKISACPYDYRDLIFLNEVDPETDFLLAWIHGDAIKVLNSLIPVLSAQKVRLVWIVGSAFATPGNNTALPTIPNHIDIQTVVLGWKQDRKIRRWLTHAEINTGVIDAMENPSRKKTIVGQVTPWSERPN